MKTKEKSKLIACLLVLVATVGVFSVKSFAVDPGSVQFPLSIKIYDPENGTTKDKTYNSANDPLGFDITFNGKSHWFYRTFRRVFLGWSTDEKYKSAAAVDKMSSKERVYRNVETIGTVLKDLDTVDENTTLYPVSMPVVKLSSLMTSLSKGGGTSHINIFQPDEKIFEEDQLIVSSTGENDTSATERTIVSYLGKADNYNIRAVSEFIYSDPRTPFLIIENPLGVIGSAKGVTDFSGLKPTNYTYEDLHIVLDENASVSTTQKDWTLSSSTFMVAAVLDKDGNVMTMTSLEQPTPSSLISKFSFENPDGKKEFIVRAIPRNDNSDGAYENSTYPSGNIGTVNGIDVLKPMELSTGDWSNISIPKDSAKKAATNEDPNVEKFVFNGDASGSVKIDKKALTGGAMFIAWLLPNSQTIGKVNSTNNVIFDFVIPTAKFDKNSASLGDTEEQTIGYSVFTVGQGMDDDDFNTDTPPGDVNAKGDTFAKDFEVNQEYVINGKDYTFLGWNTKADGNGTTVDANTPITADMLNRKNNEDITLFAIWKEYVAPAQYNATYKFVSKTDGKELPTEVSNLLPQTQTGLDNGTQVTPVAPEKTEVTADGGVWKFQGYTPEQATVDGADIVFEGGWIFVAGEQSPAGPENSGKTESTTPTTTASQSDALATGDTNNLILWGTILGASLIGIIAAVFANKKKKSK